MKNHLTILAFSIAVCTFLVAQGSRADRSLPTKSTAAYIGDQQDTSRRDTSKMHKKWKKSKDTSWHRERKDTSILRQ